MIAALLAKSLSPHMVSGLQNLSIHISFQRVMYANHSSPGEQPSGEKEFVYKSIGCARQANTTSYDVFPYEGNTRRRIQKPKQQPPPAEDYIMDFVLPVDSSRDWVESQNGNYILRDSSGILATVFRKHYVDESPWKIIINKGGRGFIVADEYFFDDMEARERAEAVVDGFATDAVLKSIPQRSY